MTSTKGSTTSRAERVRARLEAAQSRAEAARSTSSAVDALWSFGSNDRLLGGSLLAGALAYRLFLWLLPLALVLAAGLGFIGAADREAPEELAGDLGLTAYVSSSVADAADQARGGRWALLVIGLVALTISSAAGAKTVRAIHARAWGMPPSAAKGSATAVVGFVGFSVLGVAVTLAGGWASDRSPGLGVAVRLLTVLAFAALWLAASTRLPRPRGVPWIALVPGAVLFGVGAQLLHLVTVFYLAGKLQSSSELYGALGGAAAVLLWLFLIGRLVVGSAVLNATLWERRHGA
jgi:uncharacterized BrkB/YihY/UPF0761 family membrane protein